MKIFGSLFILTAMTVALQPLAATTQKPTAPALKQANREAKKLPPVKKVEAKHTWETPVQISAPPPQDPILKNESTCITSIFSPTSPPFPTNSLSSLTVQFNSYISPSLFINPKNGDNLVSVFSRDGFKDSSGTYFGGSLDNLIAYSKDGGKSWSVTSAAPVPCLGGTVSTTAVPLIIPCSFSPKGALYFAGFFADDQPFDGRPNTKSGIFVKQSRDGGAKWSDTVYVDETDSSVFATPIDTDGFVGGAGFEDSRQGSILADPLNDDRVHVTWSKIFFPSTLYGNIWYARSKDSGKCFSTPVMIYDMVNDAVWTARHADNAFFPLGGQSIGGTIVSVPNDKKEHDDCDQILLNGFIRLYPQVGATTYSQDPSDSVFDHAVVASYDNGETWSQIAYELPEYLFGFSHNPTGEPSFSLITSDGSLNCPMAVSPKTNRVYMAWQGGNLAVSSDPEIAQFYPMIQLSVSDDAGKTWSSAVKVNLTPDIAFDPSNPTGAAGASQAFNPNLAFKADGYLGIIYSDFRYYDPSNPSNVPTDTWLAIYKEVKDKDGGSTGVGLDLVEEIRLTPRSFNAVIGFDSTINGVGANNGIAAKGSKFFTSFAQTVQGNLSTSTGPYGETIDPNNRLSVFFEKAKP